MYYLSIRTSWLKETTELRLNDLKDAIFPYPVIEQKFFEDIIALFRQQKNYGVEAGLLRVMTEDRKELNPDFWILIWGEDFKGRVYQMLFERHPEQAGKGIIAAAGPTEFYEFLSGMKENAIAPTLTLFNSPDKMKSVAILVSKPKAQPQQAKDKQSIQALGRFQNWINTLKTTPNVRGQWFPSTKPLCPICNEPLLEFNGVEIGFGMKQLVCPRCGATKPIL